MKSGTGVSGNQASSQQVGYFDSYLNKMKYEYDDYMIEVLDFEFMSVDCIYYEEKENRHGNTGFFHQGYSYKERAGSVYERTPHKMEIPLSMEAATLQELKCCLITA